MHIFLKHGILYIDAARELAEDLQYLVGKYYFDYETGVHCQVESIEYDEDNMVAVGYRKAMDGRLHKDDDAAYAVYGEVEYYPWSKYGELTVV